MKIIGYKTVSENDSSRLDEMVNKYLKRKWQIFGSPYFADENYCQALVWYSDCGKCPYDQDDSDVIMED